MDEYEQCVRSLTKIDIVTLLDLSWGKSGLVRGDKLIKTLIDLVGDKLIEELTIPFTAVATDIKSQKEIWIQSGRLFDAIRASFAIPLFFTPFKYKGIDLVDGGILNPVPIAPTFCDKTDMTIDVNLGAPAQNPEKPSTLSSAPSISPSPFREKIKHYIKLRQQSMTSSSSRDWGAYDIAIQSFEAMQSTIARQKLAAYPPDIVIEIARNACRTLEFDRASEMIELGHRKASEYLTQAVRQE